MKLYSYYRSSSAYRVRIALHHKNIEFEYIPVHLVKEGGEQHKDEYLEVNPHKQVPSLIVEGGALSQSMAILLYLEDLKSPTLLPTDSFAKAKVLEMCELINSGIQPLQNLSVMNELKSRFQISDDDKKSWSHDMIENGFIALETHLKKSAGDYSYGNEITLTDLYLVPQVYNAVRFNVNMQRFPLISKVNENCLLLDCFKLAHPENQPDTPQ